MNKLVTVITYTSNREENDFQKKIFEDLEKTVIDLDLDWITVSQKPISYGRNICVGEVGANDHNLYRQVQMACKAASTPFVISAEADCLYPKEYFEFKPPTTESFYRYANVWILYKKFDYFFKKTSSECAMMAGRDYYIDQIDRMLAGRPEWDGSPRVKLGNMKMLLGWRTFGGGGNPVVSFKTRNGLRQFTRTISGTSDVTTLPHWGTVAELKSKYL